jgi:hypothetical protein
MFQHHLKTLPILRVQLKTFGHTGENSPEVLRAPLARVVPLRRVLVGGRRREVEGARLQIACGRAQ